MPDSPLTIGLKHTEHTLTLGDLCGMQSCFKECGLERQHWHSHMVYAKGFMYERQREFINTTQAGIDGCVLMEEAHIIMARVMFPELNIHWNIPNWILHTASYKDWLPFLPSVTTWPFTLHILFSMHSLLYCFIFLTLLSDRLFFFK